MGGDIYRINAGFRHCTVTACSFNFDSEKCAACHADTLTAKKHTGRSTGINMESHTGINLRIFKDSGCKHFLCTGKALLVRLKYKFNIAFKFICMCFEELCGAKEHGRMHIVTAGMHEAVLGSEFYRRFLFYCKSIHVCAQKNCFAVGRCLTSTKDSHNSAFTYFLRFITVLPKLFYNKCLRLRQHRSRLGTTVYMSSDFFKLSQKLFCFFQIIHCLFLHGVIAAQIIDEIIIPHFCHKNLSPS